MEIKKTPMLQKETVNGEEVRNQTETHCPVMRYLPCFIYSRSEPTFGSSVVIAEFGIHSKTLLLVGGSPRQ